MGVETRYGKVFSLAITYCCILFFSTEVYGSECLDLRIWTEKAEYYSFEPILVNYEVTNNSDMSRATIFDAFGEYFHIQDDSGRVYNNTIFTSYLYMPDTLRQNKSATGHEEIDRRYHVNQPGIYTCYLELPDWPVYPKCGKPIKSNIIEIKIAVPEGEERQALDMYLSIDSLSRSYTSHEEKKEVWSKAFHAFLHMQKLYPQSVYAPLAVHRAILERRSIDDKSKVITACQTIIEEYPDSPFMGWAFFHLYDNYKKLNAMSSAVEYLSSLIERNPDDNVMERAEYWLEKIQKEQSELK